MSKKPTSKRTGTGKPVDRSLDAERVIEALVSLKKMRKYPALPGEIRSVLSLPESTNEAVKKHLGAFAKKGILKASRKGRYGAYLLAGDDPRYATGKDDLIKLKFELLGEIEVLKAKILELQATADDVVETSQEAEARVTGNDGEKIEDRVLQRIKGLSKRARRRTLDLWEIRKSLHDVPRQTLDRALERLGAAWRLELQLVQDSTKLSDEERAALLRLTDGSVIGAVAVGADYGGFGGQRES